MAVHGRFLPLSQLALACTALCCKTVSYMHRIACKVLVLPTNIIFKMSSPSGTCFKF